MKTIADLIAGMEQIAPPVLAESWDPIGLQIGDRSQGVERVLLTLDVTAAAVQRAADLQAQLIISHHPLIFSPLRTLLATIPEQQTVLRLAARSIALYAAHTNLDAAPGGVADALADAVGLPPAGSADLNARQILVPARLPEWSGRAGHGRLASWPAARMETPAMLGAFRHDITSRLGSAGCRINTDVDRRIHRIAVCPGSFDESWISLLEENRIDVLVTGELKHHVGLMLDIRGIAALDVGHDVSERVVLRPLADRLQQLYPEISFAVYDGLDYNKMAF